MDGGDVQTILSDGTRCSDISKININANAWVEDNCNDKQKPTNHAKVPASILCLGAAW